MSKVAVVYWSGTGNTEEMANKVAEGAKAAGAEVEVISADDVPWAFIFVREDQYPRHPGQLYEALAYFCFFLLILFIYKKRGPKSVGTGFYFGLCLTLIFTFRFFIEYTKEIQVAFEAGLPMDMGQILSIPLIIAGVWSIASSTKRAKEKNVETK